MSKRPDPVYKIRIPRANGLKKDDLAHLLKIDPEDIERINRPAFLSPDDIAEHLGIKRMEVYRRIAEGRLVAHNFGGGKRRAVWRITPEDLDAYIRASRPAS